MKKTEDPEELQNLREERDDVLRTAAAGVILITTLLQPFIPETAGYILDYMIEVGSPIIDSGMLPSKKEIKFSFSTEAFKKPFIKLDPDEIAEILKTQ